MRVIDDPTVAREVVFDINTARLQVDYPEASQATIDESAAYTADRYIKDMQPSADNSHDPLRLIRIESTAGTPVLPYTIAEEIKFRVKPGLAEELITADEVLYATLNPADPQTLL